MWGKVIFSVYESKYCKIQDVRDLFYSYTIQDFLALKDYIDQREAIEEALEIDSKAEEDKSKLAGNLTR